MLPFGIKQIPEKTLLKEHTSLSMATMQLFKPADERCFTNSYSHQSLAASWAQTKPSQPYCTDYSTGYNQKQNQYFSETLVPPYGPGYHASQGLVTQSTFSHGKPAGIHSSFGSGFPVIGSQHSTHDYSQQGTYSSTQQGSYGLASHGSYDLGQHGSLGLAQSSFGVPQHGTSGLMKHNSYGDVPYGMGHNGSYGLGHNGSYGSGHHGSYGFGQHGSYGLPHQESFASAECQYSAGWVPKKKYYRRRTYNGCRSVDAGDSDSGSETEDEGEIDSDHEHR